jgi:uncharacterized repeat protein (TIGR03803 family)
LFFVLILIVCLEFGRLTFGNMKTLAALLLWAIALANLQAQSFTNMTVVGFTGTNGSYPLSVVLQGNTLYGATLHGAYSPYASGFGTVFSVNANGTGFTNLVEFMGPPGDGAFCNGIVCQSNMLYGTTTGGGAYGYGTLFSLASNGTNDTVLHNFDYTNGALPEQYVILVSNVLYGTTFYPTSGIVYKWNIGASTYQIIHRFSPPTQNAAGTYTNQEGETPLGGVIFNNGTLYGATIYGGYFGQGTVYRVNIDGTGFTNLYNFTAKDPSTGTNIDGAAAESALTLVGNTLYGLAYTGGYYGVGSLFCVDTGGHSFTNLYNFTGGNDGGYPQASLVSSGNKLYGSTSYGGSDEGGTVFAINTDGSQLTNLYNFTGSSDGSEPIGPLIYTNNIFYGTAMNGGVDYDGTVFSLFSPASSAPAPILSIELSGKQDVVFWPASAIGFVLQSTPSLSPPGWSTITTGIITNGLDCYYTNAPTTTLFFRLYQ